MRLKKKLGAAVSAVALVGAAAGIAVGVSVAAGAATGTSGGTWVAAQPFPGFSASDATLQAITCPSLGNCVAVGYTSAATTTPIVVTETNGVWGSAQVINGTGSLGNGSGGILTNVSCGGPGDCTATGTYPGTNGVATAFYVSETAGTWGTPAAVTCAGQPKGSRPSPRRRHPRAVARTASPVPHRPSRRPHHAPPDRRSPPRPARSRTTNPRANPHSPDRPSCCP
jgi:hypothetical protein